MKRFLSALIFCLHVTIFCTAGRGETPGNGAKSQGLQPGVGKEYALIVQTPSEDINQAAALAVEALSRSTMKKAGIMVPTADGSYGVYPAWIHPYDNYWMNHITSYFFPRESVEWPIRLFAAYQLPSGEIGGGVYDIPETEWRQKWVDAGGLKGWQGKFATPLPEWANRAEKTPDKAAYPIYVRDHLFVLQVFDQWRNSGSMPFLIEMYGHCRRALKFLKEQRDTDGNGLIETTAVLSDLVVNQDKDNFSTERAEDQVMLYGALLAFEQMAKALGGVDDAKWASDWAAQIKDLTNKTFWQPEGRYIFGVDRKTKQPRLGYVTTTYADGYAILFGLADEDQTSAILKFMADQKFDVPGPYHIPPIKSEDSPQNPPGNYCNGGCGWGRGIMPSVALACFEHGQIQQGVDYLERQAAAACKAGSFYEYWNWEKYHGDSKPGGAAWYCETSSGFLDTLIHGLFGLSSPEPGYHSIRFAPKLPSEWKDAALELRVPSGSRVSVHFTTSEKGREVVLKADPPLQVEVVLDWPKSDSPTFEGEGFHNWRPAQDKDAGQIDLLFATGNGRAQITGHTLATPQK